jgi:hypothetical protein
LLSRKGRLLWPEAKPLARKASFHSGNALAADAEGRALALNGQMLRPKASFLPDYPLFLTVSGLALWAGGDGVFSGTVCPGCGSGSGQGGCHTAGFGVLPTASANERASALAVRAVTSTMS